MTDTKGSNEQRDGLEADAVSTATEKTTSGTAKTLKAASSEKAGAPKKTTAAKKTATKATSAPKATAPKAATEKGDDVKTPASKNATSATAKTSAKKAEAATTEKTAKKSSTPKKATPKKVASTTTKTAIQTDQAKQAPSAKAAASKKEATTKAKTSVPNSDGGDAPVSVATPSVTSSLNDKKTKKTSAATTAKAPSASVKAPTTAESAVKGAATGKEAQATASTSAKKPATAKTGRAASSKTATGKTTKAAPKAPRKSTEKAAGTNTPQPGSKAAQPASSTEPFTESAVTATTAPSAASSMTSASHGSVKAGEQEMGILESSKALPLEGSKAKGLPAGEDRKILQGDDKTALSGSTAKALDGSTAKKLAGTSRALPAGEGTGTDEEGDAAKGTSASQAKKAASAKKGSTPKSGAKSAPKSTSRSAQKSPRTTASEAGESVESPTAAQGRAEQPLADNETEISATTSAEMPSDQKSRDDRNELAAREPQMTELVEAGATRSGEGHGQEIEQAQETSRTKDARQSKDTRQSRNARQTRDGGQGEKGEKGEHNVSEKDGAEKSTGGKGAKAPAKTDQKKSQPATRTQRRKMFVSVMPEEQIEVVITEEGQVQEYYVEMLQQQKTKGNIYKATIHNVDANLQAAFVNYGANKNGFLQIDEVHPEYYNVPHDEKSGRRFPPIQKVLKPGQELLVQVVKEPNASKGAFLTTYLSLAGRFLVLTPGREQIGVSRKVDDSGERERLREMLEDFKPGPGLGVIVRTVSMGMNKATLKKDLQNLKTTWKKVRALGTEEVAPKLIHEEIGLATRSVRDYLTDQITEVWLDDPETATDVEELATILFPKKSKLVHVHTDFSTSLFERFNLQRQLDQIQSREVPLPSGGRLVIDTTEALTAIDINSGRSGGKSNFEDTAFRTNMEAAKMIPLQLRLRDIGGQVVCDFIEMRDKSHWREVEKTVRTSMKVDRARHDVGRISSFGLLELVRQRLGSSAISVNMEVCPHCKGSGVRRNMEWQSQQALKEITRKMRAAKEQKQASVSYGADAALAMHLLNSKRQRLSHLEEQLGVTIEITLTEHE